jgi:4-amino-4-deoxy-L-arabinose transferase-like glycosyltransferase
MKLHIHHYFYLFTGFLFLGIVSVELLPDGMFMDGLLYADVSRNMAQGLGSFWKPYLTRGFCPEFYEHPPLAFGLQSLAFRIFGDSIYVERLYSLATYILVGYLIVLIWGILTNDKKNGWIPIFLWYITGGVIWAAANNMLENTMSVFVCLAVLFYLKSLKEKRFIWITLSALSLSCGLLTKGFFCLYIWAMPLIMWIFKRNKSLVHAIVDSVVIVLITLIPIAFLYLTNTSAQNYMLVYFHNQVMGSIQSVQTVDSRFAIIWWFLRSISIPISAGFIVALIAYKLGAQRKIIQLNVREFLLFIAISLSGVFPIMISLKQRHFYILTVYPLFALGLAYYLYPAIQLLITKTNNEASGFKLFKGITLGVIVVSLISCIFQVNRVSRDHDLIFDSKAVIKQVGRETTINICPEMRPNWSLHGYFSRYGNVSLESNQENVCQFYLSIGDCNKKVLDANYYLVPIETKTYKLYKIKDEGLAVKK